MQDGVDNDPECVADWCIVLILFTRIEKENSQKLLALDVIPPGIIDLVSGVQVKKRLYIFPRINLFNEPRKGNDNEKLVTGKYEGMTMYTIIARTSIPIREAIPSMNAIMTLSEESCITSIDVSTSFRDGSVAVASNGKGSLTYLIAVYAQYKVQEMARNKPVVMIMKVETREISQYRPRVQKKRTNRSL